MLVVLLVFFSCSRQLSKTEIILLTKSGKACDRIKGFLAISDLRDTSMYPLFFYDMDDRHITHCKDYFGKTVLWAKIEALRKITKVEPALRYDPENPDKAILHQYKVFIMGKE